MDGAAGVPADSDHALPGLAGIVGAQGFRGRRMRSLRRRVPGGARAGSAHYWQPWYCLLRVTSPFIHCQSRLNLGGVVHFLQANRRRGLGGAEAFNVRNTPPLGQPNGSFGAAAFGSIATTGDPRVFELVLRVKF